MVMVVGLEKVATLTTEAVDLLKRSTTRVSEGVRPGIGAVVKACEGGVKAKRRAAAAATRGRGGERAAVGGRRVDREGLWMGGRRGRVGAKARTPMLVAGDK